MIAMSMSMASLCQAAAPEIEYAYPDQSVWTVRQDANGVPENPLLRVAGALFTQAGLPWHGHVYPAARMFEKIQDGTAQFSMLVRAPSLEACCLFSSKPILSTELRAYRTGGSPAAHTKQDLAGHSVILIRGYSYAGLNDYLKDPANKVTIAIAPTHEAAFGMLGMGRGDYVIDYAGPAAEVLAAHPIADIASDPLSRMDVYLVLSKQYPDAPAVMSRLEAIGAGLDTAALLQAPK
jgi:ABC-type amino acid transport substrate-binding protein